MEPENYHTTEFTAITLYNPANFFGTESFLYIFLKNITKFISTFQEH